MRKRESITKNDRGFAVLSRITEWLRYLLKLPGAAFVYAAGKRKASQAARDMADDAAPLSLPPAAVARLTESLKHANLSGAAGGAASRTDTAAGMANDKPAWPPEEGLLIERILQETDRHNRNNVTRTEAYRTVYFHSPELHWALLAHLVSRNSGWNMTDLQGEWLPLLLDAEQRRNIFLFLERANGLIFRDAYPQLLLYEWSRRQGRSLFHLLPAFGVSSFMESVWRQFWKERNSELLSVALIVNEQYFIEERVVRNPYYEKYVLQTPFFDILPLAQLNAVIFPYGSGKERGGPRLAGLILEQFGDLRERIEFGKRLYAMLFGIPRVFNGARCFAAAVEHTGSRADYAPLLFQTRRRPQLPYEEKLQGGGLRPGASPLYSPPLHEAWDDCRFEPPEPGDWFRGTDSVKDYLTGLPLSHRFEMTNEYAMIMNKLELAVLAMPGAGKPFP